VFYRPLSALLIYSVAEVPKIEAGRWDRGQSMTTCHLSTSQLDLFYFDGRRWCLKWTCQLKAILVTPPEMTGKTGQMSARASVHPNGVNVFKTLRDREMSIKLGLYIPWITGSEILNFGLCSARGYPELSPIGTDEPPQAGH